MTVVTWLLPALCVAFNVPMTISEEDIFHFYSLVPQNARHIALMRWPDERGHSFVVSRPIEKGLPVLVMDAEYVLTNFDTYPWSPYFDDAPPHIQLMARMIYEKYEANSDSLIYHYVGTLPIEYHLLVNFTNSDWQLLSKHRTFERRITDLVDVLNTYPVFEDAMKNVTTKYEILQLETWKWAYCAVVSRGFHFDRGLWKQLRGYAPVPADNFYEGIAVSPFLDIPNHSPVPLKYRGEGYRNEKPLALGTNPRGMYLLADRAYPSIQHEFTFSYGNLTNLGLMAAYGFLLDKNLDDTFPVLIPISEDCLAIRNEETCEYTMRPYELSSDLLHHVLLKIEPKAELVSADVIEEYYRDLPRGQMTRKKLLAALQTYRRFLTKIIDEDFKQPLRIARRQLQSAIEYREKLIIRYGISEKVLVYEHLKLLEREFMKLTRIDLNI